MWYALVEINGKTGKNRIALIDITIEIKNLDELNNILKYIKYKLYYLI